jgi:hypothetical protein
VAGERCGAARNASVARSGRFSPVLHRIGAIRPTILRSAGEQLQRSSGDALAGIKPAQTCTGRWRLFGNMREVA